MEQENTGQHRGSGPFQGVKLKWTSAGLQNQRLQVRGLALPPFFPLAMANDCRAWQAEIASATEPVGRAKTRINARRASA